MGNKKVKFFAFLLLRVGFSVLHAQETVLAKGDNSYGSGGIGSCSAGQVVNTTNTGTGGSVLQEVQLPFEIQVFKELKKLWALRCNVLSILFQSLIFCC